MFKKFLMFVLAPVLLVGGLAIALLYWRRQARKGADGSSSSSTTSPTQAAQPDAPKEDSSAYARDLAIGLIGLGRDAFKAWGSSGSSSSEEEGSGFYID